MSLFALPFPTLLRDRMFGSFAYDVSLKACLYDTCIDEESWAHQRLSYDSHQMAAVSVRPCPPAALPESFAPAKAAFATLHPVRNPQAAVR